MHSDTATLQTFTRDTVDPGDDPLSSEWGVYRKTAVTLAKRVDGPFQVEVPDGSIVSCEDGWVALDSNGVPYPIMAEIFEREYELVEPGDRVRHLSPGQGVERIGGLLGDIERHGEPIVGPIGMPNLRDIGLAQHEQLLTAGEAKTAARTLLEKVGLLPEIETRTEATNTGAPERPLA